MVLMHTWHREHDKLMRPRENRQSHAAQRSTLLIQQPAYDKNTALMTSQLFGERTECDMRVGNQRITWNSGSKAESN